MKKIKLKTYQMWDVKLADEVGENASREYEVAAKTLEEAVAKAIRLGRQEDEATNADLKGQEDFTPITTLPVAVSCVRGREVHI